MGLGEMIRVIRCTNEDAEAERVATEILHQRMKRQISFKDFAILYRGNHQSRLLEIKLQAHQIPYTISGGTSFFARTEIKDIMAYLRLVVNPDDDNAFLRIINTPRRQIGTGTLEALGRYANEREIPLFDAAQEFGIQSQIPKKSLERIQRFTQWLGGVKRACEGEEPVAQIRRMVEDIDYEGWLHQNASSPKVAEKRMENVWYLVDSIKKILEKAEDDPEEQNVGIETAIAKLILRDMLERQEEADELDQVQLMTLHASKGLEYPHVFMVGMEEDLLPHRVSIEEDNIEEERRLTYVGITRAKRSLTMTLAGKRKQFGEIWDTSPSRFLEEMPQEDIELEGFGQSSPEMNQSKGTETLSNLMSLFD